MPENQWKESCKGSSGRRDNRHGHLPYPLNSSIFQFVTPLHKPVYIFGYHNGIVHQHSQRQNKGKQYNHVYLVMSNSHKHKSHKHGHGYGKANNQRVARAEEQEQNNHHKQNPHNNAVLQVVYLFPYNIRLVVGNGNFQIIGNNMLFSRLF